MTLRLNFSSLSLANLQVLMLPPSSLEDGISIFEYHLSILVASFR